MANLVAPINMLQPAEERIIEFRGLNRNTVIADGEMSDMLNLTSDSYPLLTPRKPRGTMQVPAGIMRPLNLVRRYGRIGYIAIEDPDPEDEEAESTIGFYFDGEKIPQVDDLTLDSTAVAINTKMCFFPQKKYIEIINKPQGIEVGEKYLPLEESVYLNNVEVTIDRTYASFVLTHDPDEPFSFKYDDAISIRGSLNYTPPGGTARSIECNVSCIIEEVIEDEVHNKTTIMLPMNTFIEMIGEGVSRAYLTADIERTMPDLNFVVEWNNRLWGVCNEDNAIYACKLGDPTNWQYFQGTGLDSYYAQQGTDEAWTGIAEYSGHLICFKQNSMARVYGTAPSNFQITTAKTYGCEEGSSKSIVTINDTVFYKSSIGIMAYQGGIPVCISNKFNCRHKYVVAGTEGQKYYASCVIVDEKTGKRTKGETLVLDISRNLWHIEDAPRFSSTCTLDNKLYFTSSGFDILVCALDTICDTDQFVTTDFYASDVGIVNPDVPTESSEAMDWMAVFGPFDEYIEEHKIYSKLALRVKALEPSSLKVYIAMDADTDPGSNNWELVEDIRSVSTKGDFIPIVPRRCDRYSIKLVGKGRCEIKSLTRRVRRGSFGRL